jgi:hypothetical protein
VRQSKSLRLFLFEPERVAESCWNLVEFGRMEEEGGESCYVLPEGGLKEALAGKMVAIREK